PESHQKFINKHSFPYTLLSDETGDMCTQFGVFKEKSMFGKTFLGLERTTFYIVDGKIEHIWKKVSVKGHVADIVKTLKEKANGA
ncbi:MAG: redoxin domain-containing protein, partial [Alphaproteobacteria bacterium]|nr:redoxin domain-containing protein [Alphaproteobacteria bacterium]